MSHLVIAMLLLAQVGAAAPPGAYARYNRVTKFDHYFSKYSKRYFGVAFDWRHFKAQAIGVVARIVTGPHDAHRQDPHLPIRYDTGRPSSVIRLRISQPRTTSLPCPAGLRARRPSPMMDL